MNNCSRFNCRGAFSVLHTAPAIRPAIPGLLMLVAIVILGAGCSPAPAGDREELGVAHIALSQAPADAQCLAVTGRGARSITQRFTLVVGADATLEMTGLPLGAVQFSGEAFSHPCDSPVSAEPTWVSDPTPANLVKAEIAQVTLYMHRNGRAAISVQFEDQDGGSAGAAGSGGGPADGGAGGAPGFDGSVGGVSGSSGGGGTVDGGDGGGGGSPACGQPSSDHVWARVIVNPEQGGLTSIQALGSTVWGIWGRAWLMRWDGSAWTVASPFVGVVVNDIVRGSTADDVWFTANLSEILRWNGASFIDVSPDASVGWVTDAQVVSASDAWVLKGYQQGNDRVGEVRRWNGTAWNQIPLPSALPAQVLLRHVWVTAANDVWITGLGADTGTISWRGILLHWDGTAIRRVSFGVPVEESIQIGGLWASSPTDVWLSSASLTARRLLHYDGTAWTQAFDGLFFDQIWGNCATDVWGMSADGIRHFDSTGWSKITAPTEPDGTFVPGAISGTGTDDVWVSGGRPLHWAKDFCGNSVIGPGEDCEPPDTPAGQKPACDHDCHIPRCGNLAIDSGETCDPPNGITCDQQCQTIPIVCGNGIVQPGEACDPPNGTSCGQQCQINDLSCGECTVGAERCDPAHFGPIFCDLGSDGCGHWGPTPLGSGCNGQWSPGCERSGYSAYCYWDAAGCRAEAFCLPGTFCPPGSGGCIPCTPGAPGC